jgi:hypothetical protein
MSCGETATDVPAPPISGAAVEGLVPGQLAREAALKTEIASAGDEVARAFLQGTRDGFQIWNAECADDRREGCRL